MARDLLWRFRRSIALSFIAMVLFTLALGQGSLWVWFLFTQKEQAHDTLMEKINMASRFVAEQVSQAIEKKDDKMLAQIIDNVTSDADIISIKIRNNDNKIIAQTSEPFGRKTQSLNPFFVDWKDNVEKDIILNGEKVGSVVVIYSGEHVNSFMTDLLTFAPMAQLLVFVVIILVIYIVFQRRVGDPISRIQDAIMKVTGGDYNAIIPELRDNELGDIASGLRMLVKRLVESLSKISITANTVSSTIFQIRESFQAPAELIKRQSRALNDIVESLRNANESQKVISHRTEKVSALSEDNVSALLEVKATSDEIVSTMENLFLAAESSYTIVEQLSQTSKVMSDSSREVLESVENTSASVEEILASVREVESNAKESSSLAEGVRGLAAHQGVNVVAEAVTGMDRITEKVRVAVDIVQRLELRSNDIQRILSVIRDVTERTNLLSLNASILAEQAGEYGKGFAVVADEMRGLSTRTASYTKEISGIVSTIQAEITDAAGTIEESMSMVKAGADTVYRVGETMSDILESAHKSALMAKMIERATEDQAKALHHIETSVIDINTLALKTSKAMDEQSRASIYMLGRVGQVREIAESTKKSTREQAEGNRAISRNLEFTNEQIAGIQEAVFDQQRENYGILSTVEDIRESGNRALRDIEGVSAMLGQLRKEMDHLRKEMESLGAE